MSSENSTSDKGYKPIGEILVEKGLINREQLDQALAIQRDQPQDKIGEVLVKLEFVTSKDVASAYAEQVLLMYGGDLAEDEIESL